MKLIFTFLITLLVAGCATNSSSYIDDKISPDASQFIVNDIVNQLVLALPPAHNTIVLEQSDKPFHTSLAEVLRSRGYGVTMGNETVDGVKLRYLISTIDDGVLLRLQFKQNELSRFYDNHMTPSNIFYRGAAQ